MIRNAQWILFSKYFAGECNEKEIKKINNLTKRRKAYKKIFDRLKEDNEFIENYKKMKRVDVDKAWNKLSTRIETAGGDRIIQMTEKRNRKISRQSVTWVAMAASVLLIAGLLFTYRYFENSQKPGEGYLTAEANGTELPVVLPDGSKVTLNRNSKITYPEVFGTSQRSVSLTGEAFFEVVHNPDKPFVVNAGKARIKVLGTSFSINDRSGRNQVEVFVETGKVKLYAEDAEDKSMVIEPGYVGQLTRKSQELFLNTDKNILAWKTKKIIFSETRLSEVLKVLENVYGEEIRCENKEALNWPYTNTFDNQDIQSVINVLVKSFQFKASRIQNGFILSGGRSGVN